MAESEPPIKKLKSAQDMDELIETILNSNTNLTAVMDDSYTKPLPLTKCYAGHVQDMKQLSRIILLLNEKLPLLKLSHLKRVFRQSVLLCTVQYFKGTSYDSIQEYLDNFIPELKNVFDYIKVAEVPAVAPLTKKQHLESRFKWSTNFHPSPESEALLSDSCFTAKELRQHRMFMSIAFEIINTYLSQTGVSIQDISMSSINAAVVVDPLTKSIVAIAIDNRREHPTQHAAMVAIDNVAKTQNGGVWDDNDLTKSLTRETIVKITEKFAEITFGARQFVSKKDENDPVIADNSPYLCTGYYIYLVREPCVMCAMGLVHARIKRVFYTYDNVTLGALRSKAMLHCVKHLNHRYQVFNGFDK